MVLNEVSDGLLAQLAFMKRNIQSQGAAPQCMKLEEWSKIRSKLGSAFPSVPDVSKVQSFESFRSKADSTLDALGSYYSTFIDIDDFRVTATDTLKNIAGARLTISLGLCPTLARNFLRLLVNYVKITCYVSSIEEAKVVLGMYGLAHMLKNHMQQHEQWTRVSQLVKRFDEPLVAVFADLHEGATRDLIGDRLETLIPELHQILNLALDAHLSASSSKPNPLDLMLDVKAMALPTLQFVEEMPLRGPAAAGQAELPTPGLAPNSRLLHMEIACSDEYFQAVLFGFFACPQLLARSKALNDIFRALAADCLFVPVYRDLSFAVHPELEALLKWFAKAKKQSFMEPHPTLKKTNLAKTMLPEIQRQAAENAGKIHRSRISYVTQELQKLINLLRHVPGVLAPKFPVVLATLSLARTEILWVFRHRANLPKKMKYLDANDYAAPQLPFTMYLFQEVVDTVRKYSAAVRLYYMEYLGTTHSRVLQPEIQRLTSFMEAHGPKVHAALATFVPAIRKPVQKDDSHSFEELRLNWARLEGLLAVGGHDPVASSTIGGSITRMRTIVAHSKFVDSLDTILVQVGQVSDCFWHWDEFQRAFKDIVSAEGRNAKACVTFVKVVASTVCALSPLCPDEHTTLRNEAEQKAEVFLQGIGEQVSSQLMRMLTDIEHLDAQTSPVNAASRTQKGSVDAKQQQPGAESFLRSRRAVAPLVGAETNLSELLYAVNIVASVTVFNFTFAPREYIRKRIDDFFREFFQRTIRSSAQPQQMACPTSILRKLSSCFHTLQKAVAYVDLDLAHLIRRALYEESFEAQSFDFRLGGLQKASKNWESSGQMPLALRMARWYVYILDEMPLGAAIFSEVQKNFIVLPGEKGSTVDVNLFLDKWEVRALVQLLGGHGVRILDEMLCNYVAEKARTLQRVITTNHTYFEKWGTSVQSGASTGPISPPAIQATSATEFWVAAVKIGNALACRKIITAATYDASCEYVPFLVETIKAASLHGHGSEVLRLPEALHVAENVSHACGVVGRDFPLWNALQIFAADHAWEALLPVAFASMFVTDVWRNMEYIADFDGFKTNDHVVVYTIEALFAQVEHGALRGAEPEKFISLSASVLLRLKVFGGMQDANIHAAFTFLERFATVAKVNRSVLEAYLPYVVIHAGRMDLYFQRPAAAAAAAAIASAAAEREREDDAA